MSFFPAFIGIGSNLGNSLDLVRQAFQDLASIQQSRLIACSPYYRSDPIGPPNQPDYINAVAVLETGLSPEELLMALQAIEHNHGRKRIQRWGPRTLDLDILLYGDLVLRSPRLHLPHPRLQERSFVLYPLRDVAPKLVIPGLGELDALLRRCPRLGLERVEVVS